jgi:hypothetical protein
MAVRLPAAATAYPGEPSRDSDHLGRSPARLTGDIAHKTAWWRISQPPSAVISFVKSHPPAHGRQTLTGRGEQCEPHHFPPAHCHVTVSFIGFAFPPVPGVLGTRWLLISVARQADGSTTIRVDAQVQWLVFRAASEVVPPGVGSIEVVRGSPGQTGALSRRVTDPRQIHQIVTLIDRLPIVQPGFTSCPGQSGPLVTFTFRGRGRVLANASVQASVGPWNNACDAMGFWIEGRPQTPLVRARHFLRAVGQLLGVQLTAPPGY